MSDSHKEFAFSCHATEECTRRGIPVELVHQVLNSPDRIVPGKGSKVVHQGRVTMENKVFLLRVVVAPDVEPNLVVTVYRTSRLVKYEQLP